MLLKILWRIAWRYVWPHLLIPLGVGVIVESSIALYLREDFTWNVYQWWAYFKSPESIARMWNRERFGLIIGTVITYFGIMLYYIKRDTSPKIRPLDHGKLDESLVNANSLFGTSILRMEEWFDPSAQLYLATVINERSASGNFNHQRVLLFFSQREIKSVTMPFLDGYYARCLSHLHKHYGIPLAFLEPVEILEILRTLTIEDRRNLSCPRHLIYLCDWIAPRYLRFVMCKIHGLDFSLLTKNAVGGTSAENMVLRVRKHFTHVSLETIKEVPRVQSYKKLTEEIKKRTHTNGAVNADHDFIRLCA